MPTYLDEQFFKDIKKESIRYANDYASMNERAQMIEEQERIRLREAEESYEILQSFGAIL